MGIAGRMRCQSLGTACWRDSETGKGKGLQESQAGWGRNKIQLGRIRTHRFRSVCVALARIHFIMSPVGTGVWVWIMLERTVNPRVQSLNFIPGTVGDIEGA